MVGLTINTGSMYSGKSTLLISQGEKHSRAGQEVVYIKPSIDTRYSQGKIVTHSGQAVEAVRISSGDSILLVKDLFEYGVVLIDEVQFFTEAVVGDIEVLLKRGITVYASGLDMDYRGKGFLVTMELLARADKVNKLKAICSECGADSTHSHRLTPNKEIVQVGAKDVYIPLCRKCFYEYYKEQ